MDKLCIGREGIAKILLKMGSLVFRITLGFLRELTLAVSDSAIVNICCLLTVYGEKKAYWLEYSLPGVVRIDVKGGDYLGVYSP